MRKFTVKHLLIACAIVAACSAAVIPLGVSSARGHRPSVKFRTVRGRDISIAPLDVSGVSAYQVNCPRGYVATGYGVLLGANDLVFADPTVSGRGYDFDFANPSDLDSFDSSASVRCATGKNARVYGVASTVSRTSKTALDRAARRSLHSRSR